MLTRNLRVVRFLATSITIAYAASAGVALAERIEDRGTKINKNDKVEVMLDDKATGRMAFFLAYHAITKAKGGGGGLFDGMTNKGQGTCVLTQGRGPCSGFESSEKDGDIFRFEWSGQCYTLTGPEGKPIAYCAGGSYAVPGSGTGRFAGISGGGSWWAHERPDGDLEVEWAYVWEK